MWTLWGYILTTLVSFYPLTDFKIKIFKVPYLELEKKSCLFKGPNDTIQDYERLKAIFQHLFHLRRRDRFLGCISILKCYIWFVNTQSLEYFIKRFYRGYEIRVRFSCISFLYDNFALIFLYSCILSPIFWPPPWPGQKEIDLKTFSSCGKILNLALKRSNLFCPGSLFFLHIVFLLMKICHILRH